MKTDNLRSFTKGNKKEGMDCCIGRTEIVTGLQVIVNMIAS